MENEIGEDPCFEIVTLLTHNKFLCPKFVGLLTNHLRNFYCDHLEQVVYICRSSFADVQLDVGIKFPNSENVCSASAKKFVGLHHLQ